TLGLGDDLETVGLLVAIERVFDVDIFPEEAAAVATMGDLQDLVTSKLTGAGGEKCRTSMAFYRVRSALKAVLGDVDIRPDTPLRSLWKRAPKRLFAHAQRHCTLRLAGLSRTDISGLGGLLIVAVIFGAPISLMAHVDGWLVLALAAASIAAA